MTDQKPKLIRRWFQFSLRTLLIVVTLVAGLLGAWRAYVEPYRRQRETMALIKELGGRCTLVEIQALDTNQFAVRSGIVLTGR